MIRLWIQAHPVTVDVFKCQINVGKHHTEAQVTVIQGRGESLLGRETAIELGAKNGCKPSHSDRR